MEKNRNKWEEIALSNTYTWYVRAWFLLLVKAVVPRADYISFLYMEMETHINRVCLLFAESNRVPVFRSVSAQMETQSSLEGALLWTLLRLMLSK